MKMKADNDIKIEVDSAKIESKCVDGMRPKSYLVIRIEHFEIDSVLSAIPLEELVKFADENRNLLPKNKQG